MADEQHSLKTYVSDMLALERHVHVPFGKQSTDDDFTQYADAKALVAELTSQSDRHIAALENCLERLGGHEASPVKSAVATVEGFFAGAIDSVRKTKVSKSLRDDYTALALCAAGYTMLQTTAIAMQNDDVASLAEQHLKDYAASVMQIGTSLPDVVLQELRADGMSIDMSVAQAARSAAEQAWASGSRSVHGDSGSSSGMREAAAYEATR